MPEAKLELVLWDVRDEEGRTYLHRSSNPRSVDTSLISGSPAGVMLKSISLWSELQRFQVGVGSVGSNFEFGSRDMTKFRKDWLKAWTKFALSYGRV